MLVDDPSEIVDHAETYLKDHSLLDYCDGVAMKALLMAQKDVRHGALDDDQQTRIRDAMRDLVDDLADLIREAEASLAKDKPAPVAPLDSPAMDEPEEPLEAMLPRTAVAERWTRDGAVVCVAGRTPLDEAAAHILADLLAEHSIGTHVEPFESFASNELSHLGRFDPGLVILSFLDADLSVAQARFAVRRLRRRVPDVPVVAAFWMSEADEARAIGLCSDVRADICVASLPAAIKLCLERAAAEPVEADADAA
jgi:hypothetical protein